MAKETKSEQFLSQRENLPPVISNYAAKNVSGYRREMLENEILEGKFREPGTGYTAPIGMGKTGAGNVLSSRISKNASSVTGTSGANWRGTGGTVRQSPEIYSPLWLNSNLNLPRDRATINAWSRAYFALNPIVHNAISLHSTYPISKLNIKCKHPKVEAFFANMIEEIDLLNICVQIAQEYFILGEVFPYAELDENAGKWSRIIIQNPDYISIKHSVIAGEPIISLRPDENLKRIVTGNKPSDIQQRQTLSPNIIEHIRKGENIPLSNFYVSHLARKISPYETRGTGLIVSCFRELMLLQQLRESKFAQAGNMINPLTLIKVGGADYKPSPADLEAWREVFENAQFDKDFKVFTHEQVTVEKVGSNSAIVDISGDVTQLIKEIYIGLMVPSVLMDGGGDVTYANGGVSLDVLRQRYMSFRNMLSSWLRRKVFAPISKINDFYERKDGEKILIVPEVDWNHMSLFDMGDYINNLSQLASAEPKKVPFQILYRSLGLDYEDMERKLREEQIKEVILAKEKEALAKMPLTQLRTLTSESEIVEAPEDTQALAGEEESLPGMEGGGLPTPPPMNKPPLPPGAPPPPPGPPPPA